ERDRESPVGPAAGCDRRGRGRLRALATRADAARDGRSRDRRRRRGAGEGAVTAVPALDRAVRRTRRPGGARAVPGRVRLHARLVPRLVPVARGPAGRGGRTAHGAEPAAPRLRRRARTGDLGDAVRRLPPLVAGLATLLVTSPFLFGGGSGDGDIPVF